MGKRGRVRRGGKKKPDARLKGNPSKRPGPKVGSHNKK
jgi:hypothetical protein